MDEQLQQLAEKLRRGRVKIEEAFSDALLGKSEELIKRIADLRERIESRSGEKNGDSNGESK